MNAIFSFILQTIPFYLAFNVFMLGSILYKQAMTNTAKTWPSVQGKILKSSIYYRKRAVSPIPKVTYSYDVNGKTYKARTLMPGWISEDGQEYSQNIVARYPEGSEVTVYYNPKHPWLACLEKYSLSQNEDWGLLIAGNLIMPFIVLVYKLVSGH